MAGTVQTDLKSITLTAGEVAAAYAYGQDAVGMISAAIQAAVDCAALCTQISARIGAGANATKLGTTIVNELS
jgi:hypothetical protein